MTDPHKVDKSTGLRHLINATRNTSHGLKAAFRNESAFRQIVALNVIMIPLGLWLGTTGVERALLVGSLLLLMIVELLNSGIEAVVDRVGLERHPLSGLSKDIASAAVGVAIANVFIMWGLILWPHYGSVFIRYMSSS
jgi:diacylglycerol kinase (ATP)